MVAAMLFLALSLLAEIAGTIAGFGSSVLFVPMANLFFGFQTVLGITAMFHLASNLAKLGLFRAGIDRALLLKLGVPSVLCAIFGGLLGTRIGTGALELTLALFLIAFSGWMLWRFDWRLVASTRNAVLGGALSGAMAGLIGTGGAVRGLTLAAYGLPKNVFVATSAAIDLAIDVSRTVVYAGSGYIRSADLVWVPPLVLIAFVGTWLGRSWLQRIPQHRFRQIALCLVFAIGWLTLIGLFVRG